MVSSMDVLTQEVIASDHYPIVLHFSIPAVQVDLESKYDDVDDKHETMCVAPAVPATHYVATSTIPGAGNGLFAKRSFKPGEFIIEYTGKTINHSDKVSLYPRNDGEYVLQCSRDRYVDAADSSCSSDARYINTAGNHNNARFRVSHSRGHSTVKVYATSHIPIHHEVFMAYGGTFRGPRNAPCATAQLQHIHQQTQQQTQPAPAREQAHAPPAPTERERWKVTNELVDWQLFQDYIKEAVQDWNGKYSEWAGNNTPNTLTQTQIDNCWNELLHVITSSARACVGVTHVRPNSKEWWSYAPNILSLHESYRLARRRRRSMNKAGGVVSLISRVATQAAYIKAKSDFKKAVREAKAAQWLALAGSCDTTTPDNRHKLLWSASKRLMSSARIPAASFCDEHGAPPTSPQQAINNMAAHLACIVSVS